MTGTDGPSVGGARPLRAALADVHERARRVEAASHTLRELGDSLRDDTSPPDVLGETLAALSRDVARLAADVTAARELIRPARAPGTPSP